MRFSALVALNLAVVRIAPVVVREPVFLLGLVALNVVLVQAVVLGRPLGGFHYTFMLIGIVLISVISMSGPSARLRMTQRCLRIVDEPRRWFGFEHPLVLSVDLRVAEPVLVDLFSIVPAWVGGVVVSRFLRRRNRPFGQVPQGIMAVFQGMVIGLGFLIVVLLSVHFLTPERWWDKVLQTPLGSLALKSALMLCPIVGGVSVLIWTRRNLAARER
jgi:hypothetical protein